MLRRCVTSLRSTRHTTVLPLPLPLVVVAYQPTTVVTRHLATPSATARPTGRPIQAAQREAHAATMAQAAEKDSKANIAQLLASLPINERIASKEVRLVHEGATKVIPLYEAIAVAKKLELDLIQVADNASPPVCKIMDARSFLYDKLKKEKEKAKQEKKSLAEQRTLWVGVKCDPHDLATKSRKIRSILDDGDSVRVQFRGHGDEDMRETAQRLVAMLEDTASTNDDITQLSKATNPSIVFFLSKKAKLKRKQATA